MQQSQSVRNYSQYSGAEEWLRYTYPFLYSIWLQTVSMSSKESMNFELTCSVCGVKPSSGLHYGVKMCEADKQFLKRTFHYQIIYSACVKEGAEVCEPRPRGWCQICRLRKCLSTPVTISMIRIGNKTKQKMKTQSKSVSNPLFSISVDLTPKVEQLDSYQNEFLMNHQKEEINYFEKFSTLRDSKSSLTNSLKRLAPIDEDYCEPLDLSVKKENSFKEKSWRPVDVDGYRQPTSYILMTSYDEPLDLSPLSHHDDQEEAADLSRPGSRDSSRRTPSPILDTSQAINKLSVNSTVLGDALSRIQGNISMSNSLVNLSSISDILSVSQTEK